MSITGLGPRGFADYTYQELIKSQFSWIEDEAIWEFLYSEVQKSGLDPSKRRICDAYSISTWDQFRVKSGSLRPVWLLRHHYTSYLALYLHKACLPGEAKVKLYFGLGMPVDLEYLRELRTESVVEVDRYNRMVLFSHGVHRKMSFTFPGKARPHIVVPELVKILMFLCVRIHDTFTGDVRKPQTIPNDTELFNEYKDKVNTTASVPILQKLFREEVAPNLKDTALDLITKAKLCFSLRIPVHPELLEQFQDFARVELDEGRRIINFRDRNGYQMCVDDTHPHAFSTRNAFTQEEETRMYAFVYTKIKIAATHRIKRDQSALFSAVFWEEFNKKNSVYRDPNVYMKHFRHVMLPVLHLANMPNPMKMALYFALELPPHEDFMKLLRKDGIVELDRNGCIIAFKERSVKRSASEAGEVIDIEKEGPEAKIQKKDCEIEENQESSSKSSPAVNQPSGQEVVLYTAPKVNDILNMIDVQETLNQLIQQTENNELSP